MEYFDNLCILCLARNKKIKSAVLLDNDGIAVEDKLKYTLSELENLNPEIPKYICTDCLYDLNYVYKFKQRCLKNLESVNHQMKEIAKNRTCTNKFVHNSTNVIRNENLETKDQQAQDKVVFKTEEDNCNDADNKYDILFFDEIHTQYSQDPTAEHADDDNHNIKCNTSSTTCEENFKISASSNAGTSSETYIEEEIAKPEFVNTEISIKDEPLDEGTFKKINITDILQHEATNRSENDPISIFSLDEHKKIYTCNVCQKTFFKTYNLKEHLRTHTGEKPYRCEVCNKAYSHKSSLIIHQRIHSGDRPYQCDLCDRSFTRKNHYNYHMLRHTGEKSYKCEFCPYKCTTSAGLKSHTRRRHSSGLNS